MRERTPAVRGASVRIPLEFSAEGLGSLSLSLCLLEGTSMVFSSRIPPTWTNPGSWVAADLQEERCWLHPQCQVLAIVALQFHCALKQRACVGLIMSVVLYLIPGASTASEGKSPGQRGKGALLPVLRFASGNL